MSNTSALDENWSTRAQCLRVGPGAMRRVAMGVDMTPRYRSPVTFLDYPSEGHDRVRSHGDLAHATLDGTPDSVGIQSVRAPQFTW